MSHLARLRSSPSGVGGECSLADKVAWMRSRLREGDEAIETHFAWVFLEGRRAWKLRKPVRRESMDYGTLEARRRDSEAEVRLNRRLAPHVYVGTRPLTRAPGGRLAIDGQGEVVDWLVEMRRLDRTRMLDVVLARGEVTDADLRGIAKRLAEFYAAEPPVVTSAAVLEARLRMQVAANHAVISQLDAPRSDAVRDAQRAFLDAHGDWLAARAAGGCVVEAHGDLRPEHILLGDPPAVIDCLEFDRRLRILDRAEELAFLELECARLGHPDVGRRLARDCLARLGDAVPEELLQFYRSHRATTRAKLYVWRAREPDGSPQQWHAIARDYLADAWVAAAGARPPSDP